MYPRILLVALLVGTAVSRQTHSSHECTANGDWQERTCALLNVCAISPFTPHIKYFYYMGDDTTMPPSPVASALGRIDNTDSRHAFDVQVVIEPMPSRARVMRGTTMLSRRYGVGNWGHLLVDNLLPIFAAYELMGKAGPLHLAFDDLCSYPNTKYTSTLFEYTPESCAHMSQRAYPYLTDEPLLFLRGNDLNTTSIANPHHTVCFERLVVGYGKWGAFSPSGRGFSRLPTGTLGRFRELMWSRYPSSFASTPNALVSLKPERTRRRITNSDEILSNMLGWGWPAEMVDFAKLSMNATMALMRSVSLIVSPGGATCMINLFMRPGSTLLLAPNCDCDDSTFSCIGPTHDYYSVFAFNPDVKTEYLTVRAKNEVTPGVGGHCDVRVVDFEFIRRFFE